MRALNYRVVEYSASAVTAYHPRLINCKNFKQLDWKMEELALFIISTSGDGNH